MSAVKRPHAVSRPPGQPWRLGAPRAAVHRRAKLVLVRCQQQPTCLAQSVSSFNTNVAVWQIPDSDEFPLEMRDSRVLMLDYSGSPHSIYRKDRVLTGAYWDCLGLLPAIVPAGELLILGLGAGTIAQLIHAYYPDRCMHGWELDPTVVMLAEQHMGMQLLTEKGCLVAHVGDALADSAKIAAPGAAGIIVDLFVNGRLIPSLTQTQSWKSICHRLAPGGRVMANLGAAPVTEEHDQHAVQTTQAALAAMAEAFDGQLAYCPLCIGNSANMMVFSGALPGVQGWSAVPADLTQYVEGWRPYDAIQS